MSVKQSDIKLYGSASMPDDDVPVDIGGAIDKTRKLSFTDMAVTGSAEIVSSDVGDTTQSITLTFRDAAGVLSSEAKTLSGLTPVAYVATIERFLKAIKSLTTIGDIALMASTAERTGTAQAGAAETITLDAGASAVDGFYNGMVIRLTSGTGANQIRSIIRYVGATKVATVSRDYSTPPDATSVFRIAVGMVFDDLPVEIFEVRRPFFDSAADPPGGSTKTYYDKGFFENEHATLALTSAVIVEDDDPAGVVAFDIETVLDGSTTNGGGNNRQVAPGGFVFDSANKNVANSQSHTAGAAQGIWFELTLVAGAAALNVVYKIKEQGNTT